MEKIENIADLEIGVAKTSARALISLIEGLEYAAPEDMTGIEVRRREIARRLAEVAVALRVTPRRNAADATALPELQQRIGALEDNVRRHRDQRAVILDALGGITWEQAAPRARELVATVRAQEKDLAQIARELPPGDEQVSVPLRVRELVRELGDVARELPKNLATGAPALAVSVLMEDLRTVNAELADVAAELSTFPGDAQMSLANRVRQLVREHREMAEEMTKGADAEDVIAAATHAGPALRIPMPQDPPAVQPEDHHLAAALTALAAVVSTSMLDWRKAPCLAWVYGAMVGHPGDVVEDLQAWHGWPEETVDEMRRARAVLLAARGHGVLTSSR